MFWTAVGGGGGGAKNDDEVKEHMVHLKEDGSTLQDPALSESIFSPSVTQLQSLAQLSITRIGPNR